MSHGHCHGQDINEENAKKTLAVIIITILTMVAEIVFGSQLNIIGNYLLFTLML